MEVERERSQERNKNNRSDILCSISHCLMSTYPARNSTAGEKKKKTRILARHSSALLVSVRSGGKIYNARHLQAPHKAPGTLRLLCSTLEGIEAIRRLLLRLCSNQAPVMILKIKEAIRWLPIRHVWQWGFHDDPQIQRSHQEPFTQTFRES